MKTISVNGTPVSVSHEVVTNPKTHSVEVHCTFEAEGKSVKRVLTVGAAIAPEADRHEILAAGYDTAALQKDVDDFKQRHAERFESKIRALKLANSLAE
jgi:hypothetical protein